MSSARGARHSDGGPQCGICARKGIAHSCAQSAHRNVMISGLEGIVACVRPDRQCGQDGGGASPPRSCRPVPMATRRARRRPAEIQLLNRFRRFAVGRRVDGLGPPVEGGVPPPAAVEAAQREQAAMGWRDETRPWRCSRGTTDCRHVNRFRHCMTSVRDFEKSLGSAFTSLSSQQIQCHRQKRLIRRSTRVYNFRPIA